MAVKTGRWRPAWGVFLLWVLASPALAEPPQIITPSSVLTRPSDTNAYAQNDLIASSTTAGSVVVPSVTLATGQGVIPRLRLTTNVTTGWDLAALRVRLWSAAPTYTNGDNGAYAVATGAAGYVGACDVTLAQFADGAAGLCAPVTGSSFVVRGSKLYWDLQYLNTGSLSPISGQTLTLTAEVVN